MSVRGHKKQRKELIKNDDLVNAIDDKNQTHKYRFGQLKLDFIAKKLKVNIVKVYLPRTNTYYFVGYQHTKGFTLRKLPM